MSDFVYVKDYGYIYDIIGLFALKFSKETILESIKSFSNDFACDKEFYDSLCARCGNISEQLLPLFYVRENKTIIGSLFLMYERFHYNISYHDFIEFMCDADSLGQSLLDFYFPSNNLKINHPDLLDSVRRRLVNADYPVHLKYSILNYIIDHRQICNILLGEIDKVRRFIDELYTEAEFSLKQKIFNFEIDGSAKLYCDTFKIDRSQYNGLYFTYCLVLYDTFIFNHSQSNMLFVLGINNINTIKTLTEQVKIHLVDFGRIISDSARIKILDLLYEKEMYITEIANALNMGVTAVYYHINIMQDEGILNFHTEKKRVYYKINDKYMISLKAYLDKYIK